VVVIIVDGENDGDYVGNNNGYVGEMVIIMVVVMQMMCSGT
jgi:hypothetical protein